MQEEELLGIARDPSHPLWNRAWTELAGKYVFLVRSIARGYFLAGAEQEDVVQEGMLGLFKAVASYNAESGIKFSTYGARCIRNEILKAVRDANNGSNRILNGADTLDEADNADLGLEEDVILREQMQNLQRKLEERVTSEEKKVLDAYLDGLSYKEIGTMLGISVKKVDNTIQSIRKKLQ